MLHRTHPNINDFHVQYALPAKSVSLYPPPPPPAPPLFRPPSLPLSSFLSHSFYLSLSLTWHRVHSTAPTLWASTAAMFCRWSAQSGTVSGSVAAQLIVAAGCGGCGVRQGPFFQHHLVGLGRQTQALQTQAPRLTWLQAEKEDHVSTGVCLPDGQLCSQTWPDCRQRREKPDRYRCLSDCQLCSQTWPDCRQRREKPGRYRCLPDCQLCSAGRERRNQVTTGVYLTASFVLRPDCSTSRERRDQEGTSVYLTASLVLKPNSSTSRERRDQVGTGVYLSTSFVLRPDRSTSRERRDQVSTGVYLNASLILTRTGWKERPVGIHLSGSYVLRPGQTAGCRCTPDWMLGSHSRLLGERNDC